MKKKNWHPRQWNFKCSHEICVRVRSLIHFFPLKYNNTMNSWATGYPMCTLNFSRIGHHVRRKEKCAPQIIFDHGSIVSEIEEFLWLPWNIWNVCVCVTSVYVYITGNITNENILRKCFFLLKRRKKTPTRAFLVSTAMVFIIIIFYLLERRKKRRDRESCKHFRDVVVIQFCF